MNEVFASKVAHNRTPLGRTGQRALWKKMFGAQAGVRLTYPALIYSKRTKQTSINLHLRELHTREKLNNETVRKGKRAVSSRCGRRRMRNVRERGRTGRIDLCKQGAYRNQIGASGLKVIQAHNAFSRVH